MYPKLHPFSGLSCRTGYGRGRPKAPQFNIYLREDRASVPARSGDLTPLCPELASQVAIVGKLNDRCDQCVNIAWGYNHANSIKLCGNL